jgi:hypothetical protein
MFEDVADRLRKILGLELPRAVDCTLGEGVDCGNYPRERITYPGDDGLAIPAFLMLPKVDLRAIPWQITERRAPGLVGQGRHRVEAIASAISCVMTSSGQSVGTKP